MRTTIACLASSATSAPATARKPNGARLQKLFACALVAKGIRRTLAAEIALELRERFEKVQNHSRARSSFDVLGNGDKLALALRHVLHN